MRERLYMKGWSEREISHAEKTFKQAQAYKHPHMKILEASLYWFTLVIGVLGTIILSGVLIPVLIVGSSTWAYIMAGVFGFVLGSLLIMIIRQMHWLESHHHVFISLFIPVVALFNFFVIASRVNSFNQSIGLNNFHDPTIVGIIYLVCFLVPYVSFILIRRLRY
jgi:hypothetical protein